MSHWCHIENIFNTSYKKKSLARKQKPYTRKLSYIRDQLRMEYTGYYVWKTRYRRDDTQVVGYVGVSEDEYNKRLDHWKKHEDIGKSRSRNKKDKSVLI